MRRKADDPPESHVSTDVSDESLELLAASAASGSPPCLERLVGLIIEHRLAAPAISRLVTDPNLIEDIEQDVLVTVTRSIGGFRGEAKFTTWLYSLARNVTIGYLRRAEPSSELADDDLLDDRRPRRMSSQIAQRYVVQQAIDSLPDHLRHTVYLRDIEGLSYRDIAEHLGIELNTVRSRLSRGRALLATQLS